MAGPHEIPVFVDVATLPSYVPPEIDINAVKAAVSAGGVSAPAADMPGLRQVVADARQDGIDLKIVVVDIQLGIDTPLRDIATVVGQANPGSTVLVLNREFAGSYSPTFDRVLLEAGEDLAKTGEPVQSAQNFVSQLNTPIFPWTELTIVLTLAVLLAAVATRFLQVRSKRSVALADTDEVAE